MQQIQMTEQSIRQLTGERFYNRGYQYYQNGKVYGLSYNPQTNSWRGLVKGTKIYTIRIYFTEDMKIDTTCNCPAFETHDSCKHVAAVLLAITQDAQSNKRRYAVDRRAQEAPSQDTDLFAKQLLHTFRNKQDDIETPLQVKTEFVLSLIKTNKNSQYALSIEVKVGDKRPYVVRDIRNFLKAMTGGETYRVNQSYTYYPYTHYFNSKDQKMTEMLLTCYEQERLFGNSYVIKLENPRSIYVPPSLVDSLLELLVDINYTFRLDTNKEFSDIKKGNIEEQLTFQLDYQATNSYTLEMNDLSEFYFLNSYRYLIRDNYFYKLTYNQKAILEKLFRIMPFQNKKKQNISADEMNGFVKNVMPQFEQIGSLQMTERMEQQINTTPLHPKVYIDEIDGALKAEVEYHYGEEQFTPFSEQSVAKTIVKRETAKEQQIIQQLRDEAFMEMNHAYYLFNDDAIYSFLHEGVHELEQSANVYLSYAVKQMIDGVDKITLQSQVDYRPTEGMLDIAFDMEGISDEHVANILQALIEKKRYYRIPNGALIHLERDDFNSFQRLQQSLQLSQKQMENGRVSIPAARSFQVEDALNKTDHRYSASFQQMLEQLKHPEMLEFELPASLQAEMRDYQVTGFQWMKALSHYHLGGILADDMGLGKTLQTISYMLSEAEKQQGNYQALVIAPASLLYNWKKEIEKFAPTLSAGVIIGPKQERRQLLERFQDTNILITSYPTLRKDQDLYEEHLFDCIVLDESQAIKNHLTLTAKSVRSLQAKQFFALSGTPIENALEELWSIFYTISPGLFGSKKVFSNLDTNYISKITRPFILRRVKKDVLDELPDKIESVQYSELTKDQKEVYLGYLQRIQNELDETIETKGFDRGKLQILAGLTRLRQICCHPSLFLENYQGQSGKLDQLMERTAELEANGKRTLIFSQFSSMLEIIRDTLQANGHDVFYLDGSTPSDQRMKMVEAFNEGEKSFFLISLKAGGTGLNLTGADTVILYDLWWNPAVEEQAAGRAHRIGQKNVVQVIRFITEGTIEEKIYHLQQQKRELVDQIIQPGETLLSKLSEDEIRELLQFNEKQES
ncbi:DEAD/DEAH box helicase [Gracilibacillus caseinilyticus]|uniref:DEAD/DEAH box helicase n=1 Tax=Gracilibacillus caseinilyticus TaxID=2932256 RepID=A0ABY4EWM8_9BACI|nr:DEAD/DEAH box helicase [Gracilibacillus caseinilyticus]UOQ48272.1 DEAD/DEAH box helicase [Gracilibacillus caseinilyticus]